MGIANITNNILTDSGLDTSSFLTTSAAASTYLPLTGGTLTGALGGTSANFSGSVGIGTNTPEGSGLTVASGGILVSLDPGVNRKVLELYATSTGAKVSSSYVGASSYGNLELLTSGLARLTIADTGAATFSSSVGVGGTSLGDILHIIRNGTTSYTAMRVTNTSSTADAYFGIGGSAVTNVDLRNNAYVMNAAASGLAFGTSDAVRMFITSGGNVGIGTASPTNPLHVETTGGDLGIQIYRNVSSDGGSAPLFLSHKSTAGVIKTVNIEAIGAGDMLFRTGATGLATFGTARMSIKSGGQVNINSYSTNNEIKLAVLQTQNNHVAQFYVNNGSSNATLYARVDDTQNVFAYFDKSGVVVGSISTNGTTTAYNITSDYRLKEDLKELNGLEKVQAIKVYDYKWKSEESRMDGVLAHELAEVLPYAVHGQKDEMYEDGTEKMQGVDYSKIVPILIKAIQELKTEIDSLKNQIQDESNT
jgi:hypothetical protein